MILTLIIALLILGGLGAALLVQPRLIGVGVIALGVILLIFTSFTRVEAKNVGVLTSFGKPIDTKSSGLSLKAPWQSLTQIDGTIQTDEYTGDSCIYVRIGDGSRSCVSLTNRWEIVDEQADTIYADYRSDDPTASLRDAVVSTQLKAATQEVLASYNPIGELEVIDGSNAKAASELSFAPDYGALSEEIKSKMEERTGNELIDIKDITISYVSLSDSTQGTIDDFISEVGRTRNAAQAKNTATEQAEANEALSDSVSNNPGVLQSRCLDIVAQAVESGYQFPGGYSCFGGSTATPVLPVN